jgi:heme-degrading monooxygenase HmoA
MKVARSWRGRVPAERSDDYLAYLRRTGVPDLRATPGNLGVEVLRRGDSKTAEFLLISFWESEAAIRAFAGDPVDRARYYPEDPSFLLEMSERVEHWDIVEPQDA